MAKTTIPSELIADNAVGITQLNVSDGSNGQALVTNGSGTLSFASVGVSGISSSADATAITIDSSEDVTFAGVVTANAGVVVDNITIDGTEIDLSSGSLTIDAHTDIILDADSGVWRFKDDGTTLLQFAKDGATMKIYSAVSDADIMFQGNDGGSTVNALTLDMSAGGQLLAAPLGVSTPTYSFSNDTNTGMTRPTGDTLQFVTGGSARWRINSSGHFTPENQHARDIGGTNAEVRNIYAQGISFASNAHAGGMTSELLDDYEEGTWTPTFSGASLSEAVGSYTKIGNQVTVSYRITTTGGLPGSNSPVQIGGLPFNISNATINSVASGFGGAGSVYVGPSNVTSAAGGGGTIVSFASGGEAFLRYVVVDTTKFGYLVMGELEVSSNNSITAIGTQTYQV